MAKFASLVFSPTVSERLLIVADVSPMADAWRVLRSLKSLAPLNISLVAVFREPDVSWIWEMRLDN